MLNFDPRKWLADNRQPNGLFVATVATVTVAATETENGGSAPTGHELSRPSELAQSSDFPISQVATATVATSATLANWCDWIGRLDPRRPPEGFSPGRWHTLYDDASWLIDLHGAFAAEHGWTDADLFGVWPDKPGWGGLADRLGGSRSLVMSADRASWRSVVGNIGEGFNRGSYPDLPLLWAPSRQRDVASSRHWPAPSSNL